MTAMTSAIMPPSIILRQRLARVERRGPHLDPVRPVRSVRHDEHSVLAARPLDRDVRLARRHREALRVHEEVLDERFHLRVDAILRRRDDPVVLDVEIAARGNPRERLLRNLHALPHLGDADEIPIVDVAVRLRGDLEVVRLVAQIRELLSDVVRHTDRARHGSDQAVLNVIVLRDDADAARPLQPDLVLRQQPFVLVDLGRELVQERRDRLVEPGRQILTQAADADVAREHPKAGDHFVDVQDLLAVAEAVHQHRHGANFERVRPQAHQVAGDPLQLHEQDADVFHALRHRSFDAEQPLDREAEGKRVRLRAEIIHPLDERDHLLPLLLFGRLLDAGVEKPDRRSRGDDRLTGELHHDVQHAVRAGVLRPHVDGHQFLTKFWHVQLR